MAYKVIFTPLDQPDWQVDIFVNGVRIGQGIVQEEPTMKIAKMQASVMGMFAKGISGHAG